MHHDKIDTMLPALLAAQVIVFDWTPGAEPEVTYVSENAASVLGCQVATRGLSLFGMIARHDRHRLTQELERISEAVDTVEHVAFRLLLPNGGTRWVHAHSCRGSRDGQYRTFLFAHHAIHQSESTREESEARYQQIFDTNLAVKLLIDPTDGRIHEANQAAGRFYGYPSEQLERMNISDINMLSDTEISRELSLAKTEERLFFNFRHRLASGEVKDVEVFSGPVSWQKSKLLYSIVFDVTERNRAKLALEEKQRDLSQTLIELRAAQKQLIQKERLAAVGQFTAGVAHDFNNLLTGILSAGELMKLSSGLTVEQRSDVDLIINSSRHAASMIRQLLDFCNQSSSDFHAVDLGTLVHETAASLRDVIPDGIALRIQTEPNQNVHASTTQLQQVFTNLVFNARDAMPDGGELVVSVREVTISDDEGGSCELCQARLAGTWVLLDIVDNGCGIASGDLPRIFEPFFTMNRSGRGSGLGLAQVAGIISQHRGHITVNSNTEDGSTFRVYLPLTHRPLTPPTTSDTDAPKRGGGQRILLVEDDPAVRKSVAKTLRYLKYEVVVASEGQEAFEIVEKDARINLVLSDIVMPGMDGLKLLSRLKESGSTIPIILMSGFPAIDNEQSLAAMNTQWLAKPLNLRELSVAIDAALSDAKSDA